MNKELLDKLKFQAAAQVSPLLEGSEWQQVYSEKFAELIVAECCAQVERQYKYATKQTSTWSMSQDVQDMLKKHFGVEE